MFYFYPLTETNLKRGISYSSEKVRTPPMQVQRAAIPPINLSHGMEQRKFQFTWNQNSERSSPVREDECLQNVVAPRKLPSPLGAGPSEIQGNTPVFTAVYTEREYKCYRCSELTTQHLKMKKVSEMTQAWKFIDLRAPYPINKVPSPTMLLKLLHVFVLNHHKPMDLYWGGPF